MNSIVTATASRSATLAPEIWPALSQPSIKISYSCSRNMTSIVTTYNKKLLTSTTQLRGQASHAAVGSWVIIHWKKIASHYQSFTKPLSPPIMMKNIILDSLIRVSKHAIPNTSSLSCTRKNETALNTLWHLQSQGRQHRVHHKVVHLW